VRSISSKNRNQKNSTRHSSAFTLLGLVVVVAIIAILVAIFVVSYNNWSQSVAIAQLKSDLNNAASATENYQTLK